MAVLLIAATCVVGVAAASRQAEAGPSYVKVGSWGKRGTGNGQFGGNAYGLATDKRGNVYVADTDNRRIQVFTSKGGFKFKIAFAASESVQDVAVDATGNIWGTALQAGEARQFPPGGGASSASAKALASAVGIGADADGNVYVATSGDSNTQAVVRFDKANDWATGKTFGGFQQAGDVEVSADGSIYVADQRGAPPTVKRFDSAGKLLKTIKLQMPATAGAGAAFGIGVDLDCNVWATNVSQRNIAKYSPGGKLLATATSGDLIGQDVAFGPTGDLYVYDSGTYSVIRLAENRAKPAAAAVSGAVVVTKGVAKVRYTLSGVACPAQLSATASLTGAGISGKAAVKVAAGKTTTIAIPVKAGAGASSAQFKIVLKTNGRRTTQVRDVSVSVR